MDEEILNVIFDRSGAVWSRTGVVELPSRGDQESSAKLWHVIIWQPVIRLNHHHF